MPASCTHHTPIPTQWIGPIRYSGNVINEEIAVPLATYETPLWPSCNRGAKLSRLVEDGIRITLVSETMTRSVLLIAPDAHHAHLIAQSIHAHQAQLAQVVEKTSQYAHLTALHHEIVGNLLFLRFSLQTGDASGHNMVTKAADALINALLAQYPTLQYGSISGNYCTDKKVSAVNGILGRGKYVVAEMLIPEALCRRYLRSSAEAICALNLRKNHIGSTLAGSLRSANAHFANMLLAFYLATGQDAANIIEGSQGIVYTENRDNALYFSCTLPNLIVGAVGNGKGNQHAQIKAHLTQLGCCQTREVGDNARRLAALCAGVVLCGELSLLAAQTNAGELMRAHLALERRR